MNNRMVFTVIFKRREKDFADSLRSSVNQSRSLRTVLAGILLMLSLASLSAAPPVISRQPAGATYSKNATARFYVNASSIDGGYLEYQWYRSQPFSTPQSDINVIKTGATSLPEGLAATLITTTPTVTGTQYYYYWVEITNNKDGDSDVVESAFAQTKIVDRTLHTALMQGDFEGMGTGSNVSLGQYWNTTHDGPTSDPTSGYGGNSAYPRKVLEIYPTKGFYSSVFYNNNETNVAELSPYAACSNYQDIATMPGKIYEWSLDHAARQNAAANPQVMAVVIGPAINLTADYADFGITNRWVNNSAVTPPNYPYGTNYTTYFYDVLNKLAQDLNTTVVNLRTMTPVSSAPYTTVYGGNTYYVYLSSDTQDLFFVQRSGVYTVPAGQGTTVFGFVPITIDNGVGNLIDNVVFASGSPVAPVPTITYDNTVSLSSPTKAGYIYGIAEVRGSSVSLVPDAVAYYDPDGANPSPEVAISKTAGLGIDGWYSTYGSNTLFAGTGVITFRNLTPGKTYRIVGIPLLAVNAGLNVNESPEYVLDEGYYTDVQMPSAYEGNASVIWNVDVDTYMDDITERARAIVKNARVDVEYALLADDGSGNRPVTLNPAHIRTAWTPGTSGYATFDSLALDSYYYLVARPYGYDEVTYADAAYDIDGTTPKYIKIKTPGLIIEDIDSYDVSRLSNCMSIELKNSKTGYVYAVVDPETGVIIGSTQNGNNGSTLTFTVPDASKIYQIVTKSGDANWFRGVRIYGCLSDNFYIDYRNETVKSLSDVNGNIPTNVEYHIRSNDAGDTWILGDANTWMAGIGTQPVSLSAKILAGNTVSILDSITTFDTDATLYYRINEDYGYTGQWVNTVSELVIPERPAAPEAPVNYAFDYASEKITTVSDSLHFAQISASQWTSLLNGASWTFTDAGWGEGVSKRPFNVRIPATDASFASVVHTDTVPERPDAPPVDLKSNADISKVVIIDMIDGVSYQYYTDAEPAWVTYTPVSTTESDSILFAPNNNCYVRLAATAVAPASFITVLTSPISIQPVHFADYTYGDVPVSQAVVIKNSIATAVDVVSVELDGVNSEHFHFSAQPLTSADKQVLANSTNTNWVLIPNDDLDAGTYNTQLKMTYTYSGTQYVSYADVYLTVEKANWNMSGITGVFDVTQTKAQQLVLNIIGAPAGANLSYYYGSTQTPGNPESPVAPGGTTSYTFTASNGLQPSSTYPVSVLAKEDNNHYASALTALTTGYTAYATPVFNDIIVIDYINERLTYVAGYSDADYTLGCASCSGGPVISSPYSLYNILEDTDNNSIVFSIVHNAGSSPPYPASEAGYSSTITGRAAAPAIDANTVTPASNTASYDGRISISGLFAYRIHGTPTWNSASTSVNNLGVGDYDVRYPATSTAFASRQAIVTVSTIITQPSSVTVVECCIHDTLSITIPPTANTVAYQWYGNSTNSTSGGAAISGADTARFPVPAGLTVGTYYYYCEITTGGITTLVSDVATVTVTALSQQITSVSPSSLYVGEDITLTFSGVSPHAVYYTIDGGPESSFTVTGPDTTIVAETAGLYTFSGISGGSACPCAGYTVQVNPACPDVIPSAGILYAYGNQVMVTVDVSNQGNIAFASPVYVALHEELVTGDTIRTGRIDRPIAPGGTEQLVIVIEDISAHPGLSIIAVRVNDDGTTFPYRSECDNTNNELLLLNTLQNQIQDMEKNATLLITPHFRHRGTYANPVSVFYNEKIEYEIKVINLAAGKDVFIRDTLPLYMRYVDGSASSDGVRTVIGSPEQDVLSWTLSGIAPGADSTVTYEAGPEAGANASQPLYVNRAWVAVADSVLIIPTNGTYHQGAGTSTVTFSAGHGGSIYNAGRQAVDYGTAPREGILVAPDEGYSFAGWGHDEYISHRGELIAARSGIMHYDTLAVFGDVSFHAEFELNRYPIHYHLNAGENAADNPPVYTVESVPITLAAPSKPGDVFIGWSGSNGEEPQLTVTIPTGSTGEREYYANFLYSGHESYTIEAPAADKIWSSGNEAYIRTSRSGSIVKVYTPDGILRRQHTILSSGTTKFRLDPGIYIIKLNNSAGCKILIE